MTTAVNAWICYKHEIKKPYKPQGLKTLLAQIQNNAEKYGDDAVIQIINESMANNYQGITWDKILRHSSKPQPVSPKVKVNRFANFNQRDNDFDYIAKMERAYLNQKLAGDAP